MLEDLHTGCDTPVVLARVLHHGGGVWSQSRGEVARDLLSRSEGEGQRLVGRVRHVLESATVAFSKREEVKIGEAYIASGLSGRGILAASNVAWTLSIALLILFLPLTATEPSRSPTSGVSASLSAEWLRLS